MVAKLNLTLYQGSDFARVLEFKDESGALMDLTDYTLRAYAKTSYSDAAYAFNFGFVVRDQSTDKGLVDMTCSNGITAAVDISKPTEYIYDVELIDPFGGVRRIIEGKIKLFPEVTK